MGNKNHPKAVEGILSQVIENSPDEKCFPPFFSCFDSLTFMG